MKEKNVTQAPEETKDGPKGEPNTNREKKRIDAY